MTEPLATGRSVAPCRTCGFYRDTPNHEYGCDAAQDPCCADGPPGHSQQEHHDASACFDQACRFDHPHGGPFPHPCDATPRARGDR